MSEGPLKSSASEPHLLEEPCLHCAYPALCATCVVHWGQSGQRPGLGSDPATHQETESCHLLHALLRFYVNTVFKNYHDKAVEFGILKSFSTLANNFFVIVSKLQASQEKMFSTRESACRRFLLFYRAFKQLDREAAVTKAFGEMDILLRWMEKFNQL